VQYFLEDFSVGDPSPPVAQEALDGPLRIHLVSVGGADQVYRDIRVDEDYGSSTVR
jgi:hypothetical protein